jgi:Gene product 88
MRPASAQSKEKSMLSNKRVTISRGNRKLGAIMNVSIQPVQCCPKGIPCAEGGCYALKSLRLYTATRKAWAKNARIAKTNPRSYFSQIAHRIADRKPRYFRWHVAGDILGLDYLERMRRIAIHNPRTHFLVFTKAFTIVNAYENRAALPHNLVVIFSAWPGMRVDNPHGHRIAWMQDGTEHRVPEDAVECPGNCESCGICFRLPKLGRDVVFHKH